MKRNYLNLWLSNDAESLAPLSIKQQNFIDTVIDITKNVKTKPENDKTTINIERPAVFDNIQEFYKWFEQCKNELYLESNEKFRKIKYHHNLCNELNNYIDKVITSLNNLNEEYSSAIVKAKSFYNSCDTQLQQQRNLLVTIEAINEKLQYFEDLETMSKKFSSPTMLTLNESLMPSLNRLDECINFMQENTDNYLEASRYLFDYRQFQLSALQTIRNHVINTLKQTATQVIPENDNVLANNESVFTLYYGKFQINAHRIKSLMQQIEHRTKQSETYSQYLSDCHQCYFEIRNSLIGPVLSLAMEEMISTSGRNFCSLIRSSAKLYTHICRDEYQLYFQFFSQVNKSLNDFLDQLCLTLYDKLRPTIIHLEHLESLSEICALIKYEFMEENMHQDELESFVKAMRQLLQDTQERLVYRCNIYIETNILNYSPASGDLAYPEKLEMMKSISENLSLDNSEEIATESTKPLMKRSDSVSSIISSISDISFVRGYHPPNESRIVSSRAVVDLHGMWYPTVRSAIMCLSKLYRSLDKLTFQGLSQEVLLACIESLEIAFNQIKQRKGPIDGYLFIIKYLLIIREQIIPFQIETSIKEVYLDFTPTKTAVIDLMQQKSNLFSLTSNNALLKLIFEGTPQVSEKVIDSQKAVDNKIKDKCEEFINLVFEHLTTEMKEFILLIKSVPIQIELNEEQVNSYKNKLKESMEAFLNKKTSINKSMSLYLANNETEAIIFKQINKKVREVCEQLTRLMNTKLPDLERNVQINLSSLKENE